jgi:hypothetical protein
LDISLIVMLTGLLITGWLIATVAVILFTRGGRIATRSACCLCGATFAAGTERVEVAGEHAHPRCLRRFDAAVPGFRSAA